MRGKSWRCMALFLALAGFLASPCYSNNETQTNLHAEITRDALAGTISPENLASIIDANVSLDDPKTDGAAEKRRHFDGTAMTGAAQYINREKNRALNSAAEADMNPESRTSALRHFGLMIHCVQDFYTRSNYVELQLENPDNQVDPYNIPLVDWNKVPELVVGTHSGTRLNAAKHSDSEDPLNKESATIGSGKTVVSGKSTYHSVAKELAIRETQRQWSLFEALIRARCGDRAPAVLAALRRASTPTAAQAASVREKETQTIVGDPQEPAVPEGADEPNPNNL